MDSFTTKVRTFDAFPKVDSEHTVRSVRGSLSSIATYFFALVIFWIEVGGFLGGYVDHQFIVDDQIRTDLSINLDLLVAMPCDYLHTNAVDITNDRFLAAELLNFEEANFRTFPGFRINDDNNEFETPDLDHVMQENLRAEFAVSGQRFGKGMGGDACHIFGSIPVNQVTGDFRITAKGIGYLDREQTPYEALNFSHIIQEFSFGEFYPLIDNPLDKSGKITPESFQSYKYYASVVPTRYEKLGLIIDTNQYSITELHKEVRPRKQGRQYVPGIFFNYQFEPIKLTVEEKRIPFIQFVARLGTILGGLLILAGYLFKLYEKVLKFLFGRKYVEKDNEKREGGLLSQGDDRKDY